MIASKGNNMAPGFQNSPRFRPHIRRNRPRHIVHRHQSHAWEASMTIASLETGRHYVWGGNCDGWHLASSPNLSVIQERVPSGASELRHLHRKAEQFFYVLNGIATLEIDGAIHVLRQNEGCHVPAGMPHTLSNQHDQLLEFLVISTPPSHGDRENA